MGNLEFAAVAYRAIRNRIRSEDPTIDEQTLADTVEGLTDLHEILAAVTRSALADEALADGLRGRMNEMQERLDRFQDRASKRRDMVKEVMLELDLKKILAPDSPTWWRPAARSSRPPCVAVASTWSAASPSRARTSTSTTSARSSSPHLAASADRQRSATSPSTRRWATRASCSLGRAGVSGRCARRGSCRARARRRRAAARPRDRCRGAGR